MISKEILTREKIIHTETEREGGGGDRETETQTETYRDRDRQTDKEREKFNSLPISAYPPQPKMPPDIILF